MVMTSTTRNLSYRTRNATIFIIGKNIPTMNFPPKDFNFFSLQPLPVCFFHDWMRKPAEVSY